MNVENIAASSIREVNQILKDAQKANLEQSEKLMKATVATVVKSASLEGVGQNVDITA